MSADWSAEVGKQSRLEILARTGLLDSPPDAAFDRLTELSARLLRAPVALLSLVAFERQFFKSHVGLAEPWASRRATPLSHSFCKHVVASGDALVVGDARESALLRDNAAIGELGAVAYAGVPIEVEGERIGAFSVIDHVARLWTPDELAVLNELGRAVEAQIGLRLANAKLAERERILDAVLETMPAGVLVRDVEGSVLRTNHALERLLGRSAEELRTTDIWAITHPDDLEGDSRSRSELMAGARAVAVRTKRYQHAAGHYVWVRLSAAAMRDPRGNAEGTIAVIEDVTVEREAEAAVVNQARIYHTIVRSIPRSAVLLFDRERRYLAADGPDLLRSVGLEKAELEGRTLAEVASPERLGVLERLYERVLAGESVEYEGSRNGRVLKTRIAPVRDESGVSGGVALVQDVTEEREQVEAIRRAKVLFEATIASVRDGVVVLDARYCGLYANRAYAELLNIELEATVGLTREAFLAHVGAMAENQPVFLEAMRRAQESGSEEPLEIVLSRPRRRVLRRRSAKIELSDGPGHLVVWQDISAERALLEEREQQALTDVLTGIPNRRAAELELAKALALSERTRVPLCVAFFDVDHFKRVNDRFGHAAGDVVLKGVGEALLRAKRLTDAVARWGGEEFVAILPVALDGAVTFCERARQLIAELEFRDLGGITISAGVAERRANETLDAVLERADARLYAAKSGGRNRVQAT